MTITRPTLRSHSFRFWLFLGPDRKPQGGETVLGRGLQKCHEYLEDESREGKRQKTITVPGPLPTTGVMGEPGRGTRAGPCTAYPKSVITLASFPPMHTFSLSLDRKLRRDFRHHSVFSKFSRYIPSIPSFFLNS